MRGPGILTMLEIAAGMSIAGPMFVIGFDFLRTGQTVYGVAFFGFAVFAMFFPRFLIRRIGGPKTWVRRRIAGSDSGEAEGAESEEGDRSSPLDRLRSR